MDDDLLDAVRGRPTVSREIYGKAVDTIDVPRENATMKNPLAALRIDQDTTVDDCEALLQRLADATTDSSLTLATHWRLDSRPGGVAAGAQTLISWAQSQSEAVLVVHSQKQKRDITIRNLCSRYHGIVGAMMAGRILEIDGATDITKAVHEGVRARIDVMDKLNLEAIRRGQSLSLFCIDHSSKGYLRPFYSTTPNRGVRSASEFQDLLEEIIPRVSPKYGAEIRPVASDLAVVLHELFMNSHIHARTDVEGTVLRRSVRGVTFAERVVTSKDAYDFSLASQDLRGYLALLEKAFGPKMKMFEMSIFDSGPGMAAHIARQRLSNSVPIDEEAALVRKCFLRNASSRSKDGLGMGLPRVMSVLKRRGGFLRVRTGRLSLVRYFNPSDSAPASPISEHDLTLLDSDTLDYKVCEKGRAAGTAITILLPVGPKIA